MLTFSQLVKFNGNHKAPDYIASFPMWTPVAEMWAEWLTAIDPKRHTFARVVA